MAKSRRISTIVMGLFLFILVTSNIVWCGTTQQHKESSEEKNLVVDKIDSPCIHPLALVAGTVDNIVNSIKNRSKDFVSLVRFIINFDTGDGVQQQIRWNWGLGRRGRFMLSLPYDYYPLSFATLRFGIYSVSITLNSSILDNGSFSDICLVNTLFNLSRQVRSEVETPYLSDFKDDVICREMEESDPFKIKPIPGYGIFQMQASIYYKCWNNRANPEADIHCFGVKLAFCVTFTFIFLAVAYKLWCIYAGASNQQGEEESVNILQINLIPELFGPYSLFVYAILIFLSYLVIIFWLALRTWHVITRDEYKNRSNQRKEDFWRVFGSDVILANILYLLGLLVLYIYISRFNGRVLEKPYNWASKKRRIVCYAVVFILCFFHLSATIILFVEFILYTVIGIIINFNDVDPIWINIIIVVLVIIVIIRKFFDKYQALYNNIYSIGRKVDEENTFPNKIFEQSQNHDHGALQRQFKIKSSLLKDILKRRLPLSGHLFNAIKHIIIGLVSIGGAALIVYTIGRHVEYVITTVSLLFGAASLLKGNHLAAGEKEKNRAQDEFIQLEADLIQYANTGEIPPPEASHWRSFFTRVSSRFSNAPQRYQDDEYEILEGSTDSH